MSRFNYKISVKNLIPPIGGVYRFYAKVAYMYEDIGKKEIKVNYDFGETHGKTKDEAEERMGGKVIEWIKTQK